MLFLVVGGITGSIIDQQNRTQPQLNHEELPLASLFPSPTAGAATTIAWSVLDDEVLAVGSITNT